MSHRLSAAAKAANESDDTETHDLLVITLPDPLAPVTLYLATASLIVDGQAYAGDVRSMPTIVFSDGGNADSGSFTLENSTNKYGPIFITTDRVLDGAAVVISRAFKLADGTWEAVNRDINPDTSLPYNEPYELGRGTLRTQPVDDQTVQCSFVSDFSDSSKMLGNTMIAQHCLKQFNINGTHPNGGPCGWLVSMGGNALACDYTKSGANGCDAHGNRRFGGIPQLTPSAVNPTGGAIGGGTGGGDNGSGGTGGYGPPFHKLLDLDTDVRFPFMTS